MMRYVISYDIEDDMRRLRVARVLDDYGDRVQRSVFEANLGAEHLAAILGRLRTLIDAEKDSVRIYPLCAACVARVVKLGQGKELDDRKAVIV